MKISRLFLTLYFLFALTGHAAAEAQWINNITINEYNISWNYTEIFTGMDSIAYRISLDSELGNNDSFINTWELLKADKETRKEFKTSIQNEPDIKINNLSSWVEMTDVYSALSQEIIGKVHSTDKIENIFSVSYRLDESIYNASSIWFLGEPKSPIMINFPPGIDVMIISGMDNQTIIIDRQTDIQGYFSNSSSGKGEILINFRKNASFVVHYPRINITQTPSNVTNVTKTSYGLPGKMIKWIIIGVGIIFVILIYVFKVRKY